MKLRIVPESFKKHFSEPNEAQGVDPRSVSTYMDKFYEKPVTAYPSTPLYTNALVEQAKLAVLQALKICDRMEALGFTNFSGLRNKFEGPPKDKIEARQRDLIKKTMEGILYTFETTQAPPKDELVSLYKDRTFACRDGTLTNLQSILAEISLGNQGIGAYITQQGREFVTQFTTDMYRRNEFDEFDIGHRTAYKGMEIHDISSLVNGVASEYGFKIKTKEEDHYITGIDPETLGKLSDFLKEAFEQRDSVNTFLDGIARNVSAGLPTYTQEKYKENPSAFGLEVTETIGRLKIGDNIIDQAAITQLDGFISTGYKPNVESIIKDATTIYLHEKGVVQIPAKELELTQLRI